MIECFPMESTDLDTQLIAALEAALAARRGDPRELRLHLAALQIDVGQAQDAFQHCCQVLADGPDDVEALDLAARASRALGAEERAWRYRRVLDALAGDPPSPPARTAQVIPLRPVKK